MATFWSNYAGIWKKEVIKRQHQIMEYTNWQEMIGKKRTNESNWKWQICIFLNIYISNYYIICHFWILNNRIWHIALKMAFLNMKKSKIFAFGTIFKQNFYCSDLSGGRGWRILLRLLLLAFVDEEVANFCTLLLMPVCSWTSV